MLSADQLIIVGVVASVITQGLRLLSEKFGFVPSKVVINVALLVLSALLAVAFFGIPELGPEPVSGFLQAAVSIAGSALLVYNIVLDKVLMPPASKLAAEIKFK